MNKCYTVSEKEGFYGMTEGSRMSSNMISAQSAEEYESSAWRRERRPSNIHLQPCCFELEPRQPCRDQRIDSALLPKSYSLPLRIWG